MTTINAETQQKEIVKVDAEEAIQRLSAYGVSLKDGKALVVKTHSDNWEIPGGTPDQMFARIHDLTAENTNRSSYLALKNLKKEGVRYDLWNSQTSQGSSEA